MASIRVDGIRMDWVRCCHCGRVPLISTCYKGMEPGMGPYAILCDHGNPPEERQKWLDGERPIPFSFARSWSKTRVVANWNRMMREPAPRPGEPSPTTGD
jgi:hypothetical protein